MKNLMDDMMRSAVVALLEEDYITTKSVKKIIDNILNDTVETLISSVKLFKEEAHSSDLTETLDIIMDGIVKFAKNHSFNVDETVAYAVQKINELLEQDEAQCVRETICQSLELKGQEQEEDIVSELRAFEEFLNACELMNQEKDEEEEELDLRTQMIIDLMNGKEVEDVCIKALVDKGLIEIS